MEKKFELTDETINCYWRTLHRIKALKDFGYVKKGELGGFVEKEENLSHKGNCWIHDNVKVFGDALVYEDAKVFDNAEVYGNAEVHGDAWVFDNAEIYRNAKVHGDAKVYGDAKIHDNAEVFGNAFVCTNAEISGDVNIFDSAWIYGNAEIFDNARVYGNAKISGEALVCNNANISSKSDFCYIDSFGSRNGNTTFYKCEDGIIRVNCGCFNGTLDEFRAKVKETHGDNKFAKEYLLIADVVELKFLNK